MRPLLGLLDDNILSGETRCIFMTKFFPNGKKAAEICHRKAEISVEGWNC